MSERLRTHGEYGSAEVGKEAARRSTELQERREHHVRYEQHEQEQTAHKEALEIAKEIKEHIPKEELPATQLEAPVSEKQRERSFKQTMAHVQSELPPGARTFSKIIHNKTVEKVSDVVGTTIARPDSILSGSIFAFIAVLALYLTAKYVGFSLSGFETVGAFVVGWLVGVAYDAMRSFFKK